MPGALAHLRVFAVRQPGANVQTRRKHTKLCAIARQRHFVNDTASKVAPESVSIQMDGFNLLQVNRAASRETCSKKYDELINSPPQVGYSQETLYARAVVLKSATEVVMDMTAAPSYRQQQGQMSVPLLYANLPGALALLQEAGKSETVLDWGTTWLQDNAADSKTRDVALAMALTHCDTAAMLLEQNADNALPAAEAMASACKLLQDFGSNAQLEANITGALKEMAPKVALQQLALPVDSLQRLAGIATLKGFIWQANDSQLKMTRSDYMRAVRDHMAAEEQIELFETRPDGIDVSPDDLYETALAYVAEGFSRHKPQLVVTANKLLSKIEQQSQQSPTALDVSVELAVCCLLLGDSNSAEDALRLGPNSGPDDADPSVRSFVMAACMESDDLLPGLCALAQQWLQDVALPGFRHMPQQPVSLADWYNDRRVSIYLQVVDNGRRLHLAGAASSAKQHLSGFLAHLRSAASLPFQALQAALHPQPPQPAQPTPSLSPSAVLQPPMPTPTAPMPSQAASGMGETASMPSQTAPGASRRRLVDSHMAESGRFASSGQSPAGRGASVRPVSHQGQSNGASPQAQPAEVGTAGRPASPEEQLQLRAGLRAGPSRLDGTDVAGRLVLPDAGADAQPRVEISITQHAQPGAEAGSAMADRLQPSDADAMPDEAMSPLSRVTPARPYSPGVKHPGPSIPALTVEILEEPANRPLLQSLLGITDGIVQFDGEREMWASFQDSNLRKRRKHRALVAGAALMVAAVAFKAFQNHQAVQPLPPLAGGQKVLSNPVQFASQEAGGLTASSAKQLILQWHGAKAAALGPEHDTDVLTSVLGGDMLEAWHAQAEDLQAEERHWQYDLNSLEVLDVIVNGDTASVLAAVEETASLYEGKRLHHVCEDQYSVEYQLRSQDQDWTLVNSIVTWKG